MVRTFCRAEDTSLALWKTNKILLDEAIQIVATRILDAATNKTMYPINVQKKLILDLNAVNKGVAYTDNKVKVVVSSDIWRLV